MTEFNRLALQRSIQYTVHVKFHGGQCPTTHSPKMKSHSFCTPHNGAEVISNQFALNENCLQSFTMTFIGEKHILLLLKETNKITAHTVNPELSFKILKYFKETGHPLYSKLLLPDYEVFAQKLEKLSKKALDNIVISDDALSRNMESRMENTENGYSGLFEAPNRPLSDIETLTGIKNMLDGTKEPTTNYHNRSNSNSEKNKSQIPSDRQPIATRNFSEVSEHAPQSSMPEQDRNVRQKNSTITSSEQQMPDSPTKINIESTLLNEYVSNHIIYGGTFPFEFPLGIPEQFCNGHFKKHIFRRLLKSYTHTFEGCPNFLMLSANQIQRHAASKAVAYKAKTSNKHLEKLANLLEEPNIDIKIRESIKNPEGEEAKKLLQTIVPLVRTTGRSIPFGPLERASELSTLYGMNQRYGCHDEFVTFSQASSTQPLVIRWGSRKFQEEGENSHPGKMEDSEVIWTSSDNNKFRFLTAINSPASSSLYFDLVCRSVLSCLFGANIDYKKESFVDKKKPGIFGSSVYARACHGVVEAQARGALHLHVLLWLIYGPLWFGRFIHEKDFRQDLGKFIDGVVTASLTKKEHELRKIPRKFQYPKVLETLPEVEKRAGEIATHVQYHSHSPRCRKLPNGKHKCALGRPCVQSAQTVFDQIKLQDPPKNTVPLKMRDREVVKVEPIENPPSLYPPNRTLPLPEPDNRVIAITLKREKQEDRPVTEFFKLLTGTLCCNTCTTPVGCGQDAKAAVFYNSDYVSKNPCKLTESLPLLQTARQQAKKFPSIADDSETRMGKARFTLSKLLNLTSKLCEYSIEQCAAIVLSQKSSYKSSVMTYVYVRQAMKKVHKISLGIAVTENKTISDTSSTEHETLSDMSARDDLYDTTTDLNNYGDYGEGFDSCELVDEGKTCNIKTGQDIYEYNESNNNDGVTKVGCAQATCVGDNYLKSNSADPIQYLLSNHSDDEQDGEFHNIGNLLFASAEQDSKGKGIDFDDPNSGCGNVEMIKDNGKVTFVQQDDDYNFRPKALYFMNYLEFLCIFAREVKKKINSKNKRGRSSNLVLSFQEGHPMHKSHCLKMRSLHFTPILAGQPRPPWSSYKSLKTQKQFVLYYATLLIPWGYEYDQTKLPKRLNEYGPANEYLKATEFSGLMYKWSGAGGAVPALLRARYYTFYNIVHNMNAPYKGRIASCKWRVRGADKWSHMDPSELPPMYVNENNENSARFDPATVVAVDEAIEQLQRDTNNSTDRRRNMLINREKYIHDLETSFEKVYLTENSTLRKEKRLDNNEHSENHNSAHPSKVPFCDWNKFGAAFAEKKLQEISEGKHTESDDPTHCGEGNLNENSLPCKTSEETKESFYRRLNDGQKKAFDKAVNKVLVNEQVTLLICGMPGTGKTFTANLIVQYLATKKIYSRACSFMWAAVFQLDVPCQKTTIHNLLNGSGKSLSPENICLLIKHITWKGILEIRQKLENCSIIIMDEVSCTNNTLFVALDVILRQAFDEDKPFGGKTVILLGDFCQLPPFEGTASSLAENLALFQSSKGDIFSGQGPKTIISLQSAKLFSNFKRAVLTEQMRASDDKFHCETIERFSLSKKHCPVTQSVLDRLQYLTPELIKDGGFEDAEIAVQTNQERLLFGRLKTIHFGIHHEEPIFRWVLNMYTEKTGGDRERSSAFVDAGAEELEFYFVRGMPMIVSCSGKIGHPDWQIANAKKCIAHSFVHAERVGFVMPEEAKLPTGAGKIFTIDQPAILNVQLTSKNNETNEITLGDVIPFKLKPSKEPLQNFCKHASTITRDLLGNNLPSVLVHDVQQGVCIYVSQITRSYS